VIELHGDSRDLLVCSVPPTKGIITISDPTNRALTLLEDEQPIAVEEALSRDIIPKLKSCYQQHIAEVDFKTSK